MECQATYFYSPQSLLLVNLPIPWHILILYACVVCMLGKYLPLARG